jgi:ribose transport system substrate-binding protein
MGKNFVRTPARVLLLVFVAMVMLTSVANAQKAKETYYLLSVLSGHEYWIDMKKGFEDAAKFMGVTGIYTGPVEYDTPAQAAQLEQLIAKNPGGIAIIAGDEVQLNRGIAEAIAKGIPVITCDHDAPTSAHMAYIGTHFALAGRLAAKQMAKAIGGKGKVYFIELAGCTSCVERDNAFKAELKDNYPDITVVGQGEGGADPQLSAQTSAAALQAFPDLAGFFCADDGGGIGAAQAVVEAGKKGKVAVVCFGKTNAFYSKIRSGEIYACVSQIPYQMGFWGLMYLYMVRHDAIKLPFDWKKAGATPLPTYTDSGVYVVTKENVDNFWRPND